MNTKSEKPAIPRADTVPAVRRRWRPPGLRELTKCSNKWHNVRYWPKADMRPYETKVDCAEFSSGLTRECQLY